MRKNQPECPECKFALERVVAKEGVLWRCNKCQGTLFGSNTLLHLGSKELVETIWERAARENTLSKKHCPLCAFLMLKSDVSLNEIWFALEVCNHCFQAWFSAPEIRKVEAIFDPKPKPEPVTAEELQEYDPELRQAGTDDTWFNILRFFGLLLDTWSKADRLKRPRQ